MDMRSWKKVLLQWITECGFMERNYFNIEQSDIDVFYQNFSLQHPKTANGKFKRISDFLKGYYPQFEAHQDDENCLSSSDYIYIYSIFLHFCCVKHPQTVFHEICQRLPEHAQQCIASFFKELIETESLTKEALRHAIAHVVTAHISPPRLNESFSSNQSNSAISMGGTGGNIIGAGAGSISSCSLPSPGGFNRCDSPLKTPKRSAGPQRVSPTTPKSYLLEERTRELYNLRAQLETERYEKGLLEVQIKQNEDKILKFNQDHKKLLHQIQDLKNDILFKTSDGSGSANQGDDQIQKRLLKEMTLKENEIIKLNDIVRNLREEKALVQEKLSYAEKQIVMCMNRIRELDFKVDELSDEIERKNGTIKFLTDSKMELEQFINENRSTNMHSDLNGSMECFDTSFARNIGNTNASSNVSSPENLGASVIDIQLREKEHENSKLKEELELVKDEHKRLAKSLQDLAEKQAKEFDIVLEHSMDMEEVCHEDDSIQSDPLEQFSIFSSCMEKISSFHKTEKNRVKELEEETEKLQEENSDLTLKLETLTEEVVVLKTNVSEVEKANEDLIKDKEVMVDTITKFNLEMDQLTTQKQELYIELQSTMTTKDNLNTDLGLVKAQLELTQKTNEEFQQNNSKLQQQTEELQIINQDLQENCTVLQQQCKELREKNQELEKEFLLKTNDFEMQVKDLLEKLSAQTVEIEKYHSAEQTLKTNYEQLIIENEELKNKSRDADKHLNDLQQELLDKQADISNLAKEISEFSEKNKMLAEKIDMLMHEYEQEKISYEVKHSNSQHEIQALEKQVKQLHSERENETSKMQQEIADFSEQNKELQEQYDTLNQKYQQEKISFDAEQTERQQQIQALENEIKSLQLEKDNETAKLEKEIADCSEENTKLQEQIDSLQKECLQEKLCLENVQTNRQHTIQVLEDKINSLKMEKQKETADFSQKNKKLQEQIESLQKEYQQEKISYETLKNNHQQEIQALEAEIKNLQMEKQQEFRKLEKDFTEKSQRLQKQIDSLQQETQQEKLTRESLETKHHEEVKALGDSFNKLQKEKQAEITQFLQEIAAITDKNKALEAKMHITMEECEQQKMLEVQINRLQIALQENNDSLLSKAQANEEMQLLLAELTAKINNTLKQFETSTISEDCIQNANKLEHEVQNILQQNNELNAKLNDQEMLQSEFSQKLEQMEQQLNEKNQNLDKHSEELLKLHRINTEYETKIEKLKEIQNDFMDKVKKDLSKKEEDFSNKMQEAANEYEASLERIRIELSKEQEHHNTKEKELLMVISQHNDVKKHLQEKEKENEKLLQTIEVLQEQNEKLHLYEKRVGECSQENNNLQKEIESFKLEVNQNAQRLLEADKALNELLEITKEQEFHKQEMLRLQELLREKENAIDSQLEVQQDLEHQLQEQCEAISQLSETLKKFEQHKARLDEQIQQEQEEKALLLSSLEKSADQLKSLEGDNERQISSWEEKYKDLKQQLDDLTLQNTKFQGDLVERDAELRMSLEDHEQERESFENEMSQLKQKLSETSEHLESFDMSLMEILALMENNFNLKREMQQRTEVKNRFNVTPDTNKESKLQQLRINLNLILHLDVQLQTQLKDLSHKRDEALSNLATAQKANLSLQAKLTQQDKDLKELKEQVENDDLIVEKRVAQAIRRLEDDLLNLEKVNERLANGNFEMQETMSNQERDLKHAKAKLATLEEEKLKLKEDICTKSTLLEKLQQEEKSLQHAIKEKTQQIEKISEKSKLVESQLKEKSAKIQQLNKEHLEFKDSKQKQEKTIQALEQQINSLEAEQKKLNEKLKQLQTNNDSLEAEVSTKTKELLCLNNKTAELLQSLQNIEQQLQLTSAKLDETEALKLNSESNLLQIQSVGQQLQRDMDFLKAQQHSSLEENQRLGKEIESLKQDKLHLREEIRDTKSDLQRANDNVTQLIQQISSIRLEKEAVVEENVLLRKQLEETGKHHSSSETKLKSIVEKSQDFERKLLASENELKSVKATLEKREVNAQKLAAENTKLKDSQEASTKRIEKLALKLGDSQAKSTKLERDNEKLAKTLEANSTTVEALQKEKDSLQNEAKALKERLSRAERAHEQLAAKVQNLEYLNAQLQETKQKLEAAEIDGKSKLNKLDRLRITNDEKIRKLANSLNNAECTNVKLNLEIGSLNSQMQELKSLNSQEKIHDLTHKLEVALQDCSRYEELSEKLQLEVEVLKEDKSALSDQLSKVSLTLQITKEHCEKLCTEMEQIRSELLIIRDEKSRADIQHETSFLKLKDLEAQNDNLLSERKNLVTALETRIASLEEALTTKCKEVDDLQHEILTLRESSQSNSSLIQQQSVTANLSETEELREKLSLADEALQKEKQVIAQLRLDNQILHTKYQESKQRALDASKNSEERIKENRLELEGKLEKMKNKMKTLYTEEITKMKTKQEREVAVIKSEVDVIKAQNSKYEEHTRKLSNQIVRLNDNILEYQKENTILSTKLKHLLEHHEIEKFKRPSSIHVSTISSSTGPSSASNTGTNLAMEDEEGEVFNNTYLTDLKTGRMSEYMSREVCAEELKYRNSLLPPHLRSAYAAQYDNEIAEDELKDGPHSFDDSMSALLSTTAGSRKKCSGVTHYKRPGPPTPSKNGRLSFGGVVSGNSEPMREILKESFDGGNAAAGTVSSSSAKTPARFNFFASRFSMGYGKDEKSLTKKQHTEEPNLRKAVHKIPQVKAINRRLLGGLVCTSTPRKSKVHFDQRRLLDQLLTSSPSPSPLAMEHKHVKLEKKKITPPDVSFIETPLTALVKQDPPKAPTRKQTAKRIEAIAAGLKSKRRNSSIYGRRLSRRLQEICTPTSGDTTSSAFSNTPKDKIRRQTISSATTTSGGIAHKTVILQKRLTKKPQKERGARPSLNLRGNIFSKYRNPNRGAQHDLHKFKSRNQRLDHFNQGRNLIFKEDGTTADEETMMKNLTYDITNNNYAATFNHNHKLGETVVIAKAAEKSSEEDLEEESFLCASEVFETQNAEDWYPYDHDDYICDYDDTEEDSEVGEDEVEVQEEKPDIKYDITKERRKYKEELVTSLDLEEFDRYVCDMAKAKKEPESYASLAGSSQHFEKLVMETESNAPFEVKRIQFNISGNSSTKHTFTSTTSSTHHRNATTTQQSAELLQDHHPDHHEVSTASPHHSPSNNPGNLSRIIYGGTVIYNRRLPNINTTYVRKSSIYVKNKNHTISDSTAGNDVILITNQTITVADLARMWTQMDSSAKLIVSFAVLASFTTLLGLFLSFYSKH